MSAASDYYFDLIKSKLPLWRLVTFIFGATYPYITANSEYYSIIIGFLNKSLYKLSQIDGPVIQHITSLNILYGVLLTITSYFISNFLIKSIQTIAFRGNKSLINKIKNNDIDNSIKNLPYTDRLSISTRLLKEIEPFKEETIRLSHLTELFISLSILCFYSTYNGNIADLIIGVLFFFLATATGFFSTIIFIKKCYASLDLSKKILSQ